MSEQFEITATRETFLGWPIAFEKWISKHPSLNYFVCFHGFTGSKVDFYPLIKAYPYASNWLLIDLPGHGQTGLSLLDQPKPADQIAIELNHVLAECLSLQLPSSSVSCIAYSMGGRIALNLLNHLPRRFQKNFLLSVSDGITDPKARKARFHADQSWINLLNQGDAEAFFKKWNAQEIFGNVQGQNDKNQKTAPKILSEWARALEVFSPGIYPPTFSQTLNALTHCCWITGEYDRKFTQIARNLISNHPHHQSLVLPKTHHRLLHQNPKLLSQIIGRS